MRQPNNCKPLATTNLLKVKTKIVDLFTGCFRGEEEMRVMPRLQISKPTDFRHEGGFNSTAPLTSCASSVNHMNPVPEESHTKHHETPEATLVGNHASVTHGHETSETTLIGTYASVTHGQAMDTGNSGCMQSTWGIDDIMYENGHGQGHTESMHGSKPHLAKGRGLGDQISHVGGLYRDSSDESEVIEMDK